jgi:hypothetical protein
MTGATRQKLIDSKPVLENFTSQAEFEEATSYRMDHAGRILGMTKPAVVAPADDLMQPAEDALERWFKAQGFAL